MPHNTQNIVEDDVKAGKELTVCDKRNHSYQVQVHPIEHATGWFMKVFDVDTLAAEVKCLAQGKDFFLADLRVQDSAVHPIRGFARIKSLLGFTIHGRIENYRKRGLGSVLLRFVISLAREKAFQRIIGKLAPIDLEPNPALPDWYRHHGFTVIMEPSQLEGTLELRLR
jgi:GNAT superfamily N-acetyltransferase